MATSYNKLRNNGYFSDLQLKVRCRIEKNNLLRWMAEKNLRSINENTLLLYFSAKFETLDAPTLLTLLKSHSMLKRILSVEDNIDIIKFLKLNSFVKLRIMRYCLQRILTFSITNITKFLTEACDRDYLMEKVACIISLAGSCSKTELLRMTLDDVTDNGTSLMINIRDWKNGISRSYTVTYGLELLRKYIALRQKKTPHRQLFVDYRNGKCTVDSIDIYTYERISMRIAQFLNLPNPQQYTSHCFKNTALKLLARGELNFLTNAAKQSAMKNEKITVPISITIKGHCKINLGN